MLKLFANHFYLLVQLTKREILGRYKNSVLGLVWAFLQPLIMLAVYSFVFAVIFRARWGSGPEPEGQLEFALTLFCGLIAFNIFAENITRAPLLVVDNPNYVKRVIFPVHLLPISVLAASLVHGAISIAILLAWSQALHPHLPTMLPTLPLVLLPLVLLSLGVSWFLAAIGVYLRDLHNAIGPATQLLMFLSPVFYPLSAIPEPYRSWMELNPLTSILDNIRRVLVWNQSPDFASLALQSLLTGLLAYGSYRWFRRAQKGFADVI